MKSKVVLKVPKSEYKLLKTSNLNTMHTSMNLYIIPRLDFIKKRSEVDKGTNRKSPWNPDGARPPREEDFDQIHEQNQREKKRKENEKSSS